MAMVRLQLDINERQLKELESLMQECDIRTKKDLFNNAITLLKWAVNKRKSGYQIVAVNSDTDNYIELEMPALCAVRRSS